jgi:hypothetical protein
LIEEGFMRHVGLALLLPLLSFLAACASAPVPVGKPPSPGDVKSMVLRLQTDNMQGLTPPQMQGVAGKIAENLKSWGYPVTADVNAAATHVLEAWVTKPERTAVPPGFSITFGSDDERAPDRQKVDTVKVGCALSAAEGKGGRTTLSGEFTAPNAGKNLFTGLSDQGPEHFYMDRMGSVCLNLLTELKVGKEKSKESSSSSIMPAWIPDMRVEIKTKQGKKPGVSAPSAPAAAPAAPTKAPSASSAPASGAAPASNTPPAASASSTEALPAAPAEPESGIVVEEGVDESDQRKQLIIHNQGSPIILEFGYDENRGMKW